MTETLPPIRLEHCDTARREPGMMVFTARTGGGAPAAEPGGWITAIDQAGDIVFNLKLEAPTQDVRLHPNGNLFYSQVGIGLITECDLSGKTLRQWYAVEKWAGKTPPDGAIPVELPLIHHTLDFFPNGNFLLNSAEVRQLDDWHSSESDPAAPRAPAKIVGDVFCEVDLQGQVLRTWHAFEFLDLERICYGSLSGYWNRQGIKDSYDWSHANASRYCPIDDSLLISFRTQDCIVKLDCESGEIRWILGDEANWRDPWRHKLLRPHHGLSWQYHQHDVSLTPVGTVLCFDNGNHRACPFQEKLPPEDNYSRIVEFGVDEDQKTVRQLWSWGDEPEDRHFACFQGGAFHLPQTGNRFATYGGICTVDGVPSNSNKGALGRARLLEITPDKEIVFDMWLDASGLDQPYSLSAFRAEHVPAS